MNTDLLNTIQKMLIEFANKNDISLQAEFGSVDNFKQFVIAFTIKSLVDICGLTVVQAYDLVMGDGAWDQLAEAVWNQLQGPATSCG